MWLGRSSQMAWRFAAPPTRISRETTFPDKWNHSSSENHPVSMMLVFWATSVWSHWEQGALVCTSGGSSSWTAIKGYGRMLPLLTALWQDEKYMPVFSSSWRNDFAGEAMSQCYTPCTVLLVTEVPHHPFWVSSFLNSFYVRFLMELQYGKSVWKGSDIASMNSQPRAGVRSSVMCVTRPHNTWNMK
jgi:hypothetical protein